MKHKLKAIWKILICDRFVASFAFEKKTGDYVITSVNSELYKANYSLICIGKKQVTDYYEDGALRQQADVEMDHQIKEALSK